MVLHVSRKGRRISRPSEWNSGVDNSQTRSIGMKRVSGRIARAKPIF
jgi:hypothetical protein